MGNESQALFIVQVLGLCCDNAFTDLVRLVFSTMHDNDPEVRFLFMHPPVSGLRARARLNSMYRVIA